MAPITSTNPPTEAVASPAISPNELKKALNAAKVELQTNLSKKKQIDRNLVSLFIIL